MYYVVTRNSIPGFHCWPDAPELQSYLRDRHRHVFEITCKFAVDNADRDIEIIDMQGQIQQYLLDQYAVSQNEIDIGCMSCEAIAQEIAEQFDAFDVLVQEDGYGGGGYVREEY